MPFTPADSSYLNRHVKLYHNNNKNKRQNEKHSRRPKVAAESSPLNFPDRKELKKSARKWREKVRERITAAQANLPTKT